MVRDARRQLRKEDKKSRNDADRRVTQGSSPYLIAIVDCGFEGSLVTWGRSTNGLGSGLSAIGFGFGFLLPTSSCLTIHSFPQGVWWYMFLPRCCKGFRLCSGRVRCEAEDFRSGALTGDSRYLPLWR